MLASDSDDDILLAMSDAFEGDVHHDNRSGSGSDHSGEPPRRRRRVGNAPGPIGLPRSSTPTPSTSTHTSISVPLEFELQGRAHVDSDSDVSIYRDAYVPQQQPPPTSPRLLRSGLQLQGAPLAVLHPFPPLNYIPESQSTVPSPSSSSLQSINSLDSSVVYIDSEDDFDEEASFESFNADELSDIEVVRESEEEDGQDGSESSEVDDDPGSGSGAETGPPDSGHNLWQNRRLIRRNAIVDGLDSEVEVPPDSAAAVNVNPPMPVVIENQDADAGASTSVQNPEQAVSSASKLDESADDDGFTCLICYEPFANSGDHRLCCLKCGHTYGKICIEKWIKAEARCPQCNSKASKKDIRVIYVKNLRALDTAERDRVLADLVKEQEMKRKLELECARLRQMNQHKDVEYKAATDELMLLRERCGRVFLESGSSSGHPQPSTSAACAIRPTTSGLQFTRAKVFEFPGDSRVGAYNEWLNMLVISQTVRSSLYPHGMFGIKRINLLDMKVTLQTPVHQKEVRDLAFSPSQSDVLLSVGMDKKGILTNVNTNVSVQTFNSESPLWSCAWNTISQHIFYAGTSNGMILAYDVRNPRETLKSFTVTSTDTSPVARICFVPPSYQQQQHNFTMSGLLIQKLSSVWFCELRGEDVKFHQLPIEGAVQSLDFEPNSRHALFSTRHPVNPARHFVCDLSQYYSEVQQANVCSCNPVQTFDGSVGGLGKMCRSSIFSPTEGKVLVAANGAQGAVNLWDVSDSTWVQSIPHSFGTVLDFVPSKVNHRYLLNMISGGGVGVYGMSSNV